MRRGFRNWCAIQLALIYSGCTSTHNTTLAELPAIEQEAYVVLTDQLNQFDLGEDHSLLIICTTIRSEREPIRISASLLDALASAAPKALNVKFIDGTTCHQNNFGATLTSDGTRALNFFGSRHQNPETKEVSWVAGSTWESLWGGGEIYKIIIEDGIPRAVTTGSWDT